MTWKCKWGKVVSPQKSYGPWMTLKFDFCSISLITMGCSVTKRTRSRLGSKMGQFYYFSREVWPLTDVKFEFCLISELMDLIKLNNIYILTRTE